MYADSSNRQLIDYSKCGFVLLKWFNETDQLTLIRESLGMILIRLGTSFS